MTELRDYIWFDRGHTPLTKLTIRKVLFTQEKTALISEVLTSKNCRISELIIDNCRAKSFNMSTLFEALIDNTSVFNLSIKNMYIPLPSIDTFVEVLKHNKKLSVLTMRDTGLTDSAMNQLA